MAIQVNFLISQAYASMGETIKAKEYLAKKGNREVVMYDKVLQDMHLHSVSPSYYAQAAIHAFVSLDYDFAEKLVNHAIELDPNDINIRLIKLNIFISRNEVEKALKFIKDLSAKHPKNHRTTYSMAMVFEMTGDDDNAIVWYKKELELNPTNAGSHILLAKAYMRKRLYKQALIELRNGQEIDKQMVFPIFAEASILSHFKICDKAIPKFYDAIERRPKSFDYLIAFIKTVAMCNPKDKTTIADALNAARNMYNLSASVRITQALAMIEARAGNMQDAIDYQRQIIFMGLTQKLPREIIAYFKEDLEAYVSGKSPIIAFRYFDIELNPERSYELYQ